MVNAAIPQLPRQQYDELQGWNASLLKVVLGKTLGHAWRQCLDPDRPQIDSAAFRIGSYTHEVLLEPEVIQRYVVTEKNTTTKAYALELAEAEAKGQSLAQLKELDLARAMGHAVRQHPALGDRFPGDGHFLNELTLSWSAAGGEQCKSRLDAVRWLADHLWVGDIKTTSGSADPGEFGKNAVNYNYILQAAFYTDALSACRSSLEAILDLAEGTLAKVPIVFEFVVVEKDPPHAVARYVVTDDQMQLGRAMYERALSMVESARSIDFWPDYPVKAKALELPPWADRVLSRLAEERS
jgi:hypothetical protein